MIFLIIYGIVTLISFAFFTTLTVLLTEDDEGGVPVSCFFSNLLMAILWPFIWTYSIIYTIMQKE